MSIASLAVLGDDRPTWKPDQYSDELWGCEVKFKFPVVKLLDYSQRWAELEDNSNPFATVSRPKSFPEALPVLHFPVEMQTPEISF